MNGWIFAGLTACMCVCVCCVPESATFARVANAESLHFAVWEV